MKASLNKVVARLKTHASRDLKPWAADMLSVIAKSYPKLAKALEQSFTEAVSQPKVTGKKLVETFKREGWGPYDQIPDLWVIESKQGAAVGITVDFRPDMVDSPNTCSVSFYDDN